MPYTYILATKKSRNLPSRGFLSYTLSKAWLYFSLAQESDDHKIHIIMKATSLDKELDALKVTLHALEPLDETQRCFVLKTAAERLGIGGIIPAASGNKQERHAAGTPAIGSSTA